MVSKAMGDAKGTITSKTGTPVMSVPLKDVVHTPQDQFNLLSVTKLMIEGWTLSRDKNKMSASKGAVEMTFDTSMKKPKGQSFFANFQNFSEVGCAVMELSKCKAHELLGYSNNDSTINAEKSLDCKLTGSKQVCESFQPKKAKQKNVTKKSTHEPTTSPEEQSFVDLSKFKNPENVK